MSQLLVQELQKLMHFHYLYLQLPTLIAQKRQSSGKFDLRLQLGSGGFFIADLPQ
ncbi:MAG: hypothetical protein RMY64_25150 [Nostoc sp. DedQUE08]|uniref:hypothetical protein n=1 Tax=unclassified Nostoc TaxID=2593658 RepID=UPI002AD1EA93|nr:MULTISPECIES: hypothetical protein [unclassified Nostoc]MDZ8068883.1 hypothetical protein [Nostoc sp. DedQUE08]MDZ8131103.1 hypothetical protein [Nostoc sp. DedQUE07]MDZ8030142.1 hypothetical protein [Nostoc sp. DedSLP04]MDZ8094038.1 hypothetical protein [Nostoc sp. DedQUE05]MDZ8136450.1 hypothetical protein [Nostoc sp. DedQUE04]